MLHIGNERVPVCHGVTRRSFLQAGSAGLAGMTLMLFFFTGQNTLRLYREEKIVK